MRDNVKIGLTFLLKHAKSSNKDAKKSMMPKGTTIENIRSFCVEYKIEYGSYLVKCWLDNDVSNSKTYTVAVKKEDVPLWHKIQLDADEATDESSSLQKMMEAGVSDEETVVAGDDVTEESSDEAESGQIKGWGA